ncbi:LOW QUALITY PROTEIN: hypothetical protein PanWU01x14_294180 [Parasponia andersonii]|uniref:Uncharacterized protein n=1 Tax=Parasponia andersonii TaxID=3476 RepID=A0A2P5AWB4_PARAD|nr:LOW QUALITY PROTEIN: hypothetical protein PanWU01x14_294180 [Parasponia andersonii]
MRAIPKARNMPVAHRISELNTPYQSILTWLIEYQSRTILTNQFSHVRTHDQMKLQLIRQWETTNCQYTHCR